MVFIELVRSVGLAGNFDERFYVQDLVDGMCQEMV